MDERPNPSTPHLPPRWKTLPLTNSPHAPLIHPTTRVTTWLTYSLRVPCRFLFTGFRQPPWSDLKPSLRSRPLSKTQWPHIHPLRRPYSLRILRTSAYKIFLLFSHLLGREDPRSHTYVLIMWWSTSLLRSSTSLSCRSPLGSRPRYKTTHSLSLSTRFLSWILFALSTSYLNLYSSRNQRSPSRRSHRTTLNPTHLRFTSIW